MYGPDVIPTAAYHEQVHEIGWYQLCLGRLSIKWSTAVHSYSKAAGHLINSTRWSSLAIQAIWQYIKALWQHWNELVHGSIIEEEANHILQQIHNQVHSHYENYEEDNNYVLQRHAYLFTQKTLTQRLQMSYDYLKCWLR